MNKVSLGKDPALGMFNDYHMSRSRSQKRFEGKC